jgi:predicted ATPase/DNA-binding SARP family transcriptional activator
MVSFRLFLLGSPRLERDGQPLQFDTRKIMALVAYVAMAARESGGRPISRDSLLALLWPELEPSRARAVLRRNLSLLRKALGDEWLVVDRQAVGLDPGADFWFDVDEFLRRVDSWQAHGHTGDESCPECLSALAEAAGLYRGDFMEGLSLRDSVEFDDWQFFQAEELRRELVAALERLVGGYSAQGEYETALTYARRRLVLDPLHEPAHQQLMQLYALAGQRSAALRQYEECARVLDEEMGLEPAAETTALYEQIRAGAYPAGEPAAVPTVAPGTALPVRAAPLRHNLPAQTTPFVGRQDDLAAIAARLQEPASRLLTLLGPGGIGKTRLALRLAEEMLEAGGPQHGVFFVPLAPLQSAEGIVPAVAEALGFAFSEEAQNRGRSTPRQQLLDYLRRKQLLLILDNYEHLLAKPAGPGDNDSAGTSDNASTGDSVEFLTELLSEAPEVKVLVTSRVSLNVQGEHLYPLAGLRVPDAALPLPADAGQLRGSYSAVELFVRGARRVRPDFELQLDELTHVARICRLVQGMPLGILLAAAWVEMLAPAEIAAEIQHSLDFLETNLRDVPERQRSIRAVFDHSWRLLEPRERELFQALSVFKGSFTREAAREVAGASLRDLMSMVNKSLLLASQPGRYELHELLRQYGAERLDRAPDQGRAVRHRHCTYYSAALERWAGEIKGARQRETMTEMDLEIENGRAAWYWAVSEHNADRLAQATDGMWLYHTWRLRHREGRAAFQAAAESLRSSESLEAQRLRAKCLILWSSFQLDLAQMGAAIRAAEEAGALLHSLEQAGQDVRHEMALATFHQARIARYTEPDPLQAKGQYVQSAALYEEVGDRWGLARALAYLGSMAEQIGHFQEAQELCQRSLAIRRELGDQRGMADAMLNLGIIAWVQGHFDEADVLLRDSLEIFRALDDWIYVARTIKSLAEVLVRRGLFDDGLALFQSSGDIYEDMGSAFGNWGLLPFLAEARVHCGLYAQALAEAQQSIRLNGKLNHRWGEGFSCLIGGLAALAGGLPGEAQTLFEECLAAFDEVRQRENRGWALGPYGLAARQAGDPAAARRYVAEALQIGVELGAVMPLLYSLPVAALLRLDEGEAEQGVELYACVARHGFVANSTWFRDLIGQPIAAAAASLPAGVAELARERGRSRDLEATAARLLAAW